jgi:hypothetical protein
MSPQAETSGAQLQLRGHAFAGKGCRHTLPRKSLERALSFPANLRFEEGMGLRQTSLIVL